MCSLLVKLFIAYIAIFVTNNVYINSTSTYLVKVKPCSFLLDFNTSSFAVEVPQKYVDDKRFFGEEMETGTDIQKLITLVLQQLQEFWDGFSFTMKITIIHILKAKNMYTYFTTGFENIRLGYEILLALIEELDFTKRDALILMLVYLIMRKGGKDVSTPSSEEINEIKRIEQKVNNSILKHEVDMKVFEKQANNRHIAATERINAQNQQLILLNEKHDELIKLQANQVQHEQKVKPSQVHQIVELPTMPINQYISRPQGQSGVQPQHIPFVRPGPFLPPWFRPVKPPVNRRVQILRSDIRLKVKLSKSPVIQRGLFLPPIHYFRPPPYPFRPHGFEPPRFQTNVKQPQIPVNPFDLLTKVPQNIKISQTAANTRSQFNQAQTPRQVKQLQAPINPLSLSGVPEGAKTRSSY